jgi:hypothetical protein
MIKRIFILSGQGGKWTSLPFELELTRRLRQYGETTVHLWKDNSVISKINQLPLPVKIAVVGFSLGANQIGWISQHIANHKADLAVAYDPSKQSPLVGWSDQKMCYAQAAPNFDKVICYYRPYALYFGGSRYIGSNVKEYPVRTLHWLVQWASRLHEITERAVAGM